MQTPKHKFYNCEAFYSLAFCALSVNTFAGEGLTVVKIMFLYFFKL